MPVLKITDEWFFVSGIDVLASQETGCVVAVGDSLTDANISTHDTYSRWPDQLARRLDRAQGRPAARGASTRASAATASCTTCAATAG